MLEKKKNFITSLQKLLLWKFNSSEIRDILEDYEEYFDVGLANGKTEDELCKELGSPLTVVRSIQLECSSQKTHFTTKSLLRGFLVAILLFIVFYIYLSRNASSSLLLWPFVPVISCVLWFILGGKYFSLNWLSKNGSMQINRHFLLVHGTLFLIATIILLLMCWMMLEPESAINLLTHDDPSYIGEILNRLLSIGFIPTAIVFVYGLWIFRRDSILYFSVLCHSIGLFCMLASFMNMMSAMDTFERTQYQIIQSSICYLGGFIISILYVLYCTFTVREDRPWMHN